MIIEQTLLTDFLGRVKYVYIPFDEDKPRRGLSEKFFRRRLEQQGWQVWRGGFIHATRFHDLYPNVKKRYDLLNSLIEKHHPGMLERLQYLSGVQRGMPDFICYWNCQFKFVECKLGYESLSKRQKLCIQKLMELGFKTEVHKLAEPQTKMRAALVDVATGEKDVRARQAVLAF